MSLCSKYNNINDNDSNYYNTTVVALRLEDKASGPKA